MRAACFGLGVEGLSSAAASSTATASATSAASDATSAGVATWTAYVT